jgi:hypothetical protein
VVSRAAELAAVNHFAAAFCRRMMSEQIVHQSQGQEGGLNS